MQALETARAFDLAPIYFWLAVAHEVRFLRQHSQFPPDLGRQGASGDRNQAAIQYAAAMLIAALAQRGDVPGAATAAPVRVLVDGEARRALDQLVAKDRRYAAALVAQKGDAAALEQESLRISAVELEHLTAAEHALAALDLLRLAELMREVARSLSSEGQQVRELRREMFRIVEEARKLPILDVPAYDQIRELASLPGGD